MKVPILAWRYVNCIYNKEVAITFDPAKNERNIRERGLSFERAEEFDFSTAVFHTEVRKGEMRRVAVGIWGSDCIFYVASPVGTESA